MAAMAAKPPPSGTFLFRDNNAHFHHIIGAITDAAAAIETIEPKPLPAGLFTATALSKSKQ
jgi:hypothetical protein